MIKDNNITFFRGSDSGKWEVQSKDTIIGESLPKCMYINRASEEYILENNIWTLKGVTSNLRYTHRDEKVVLDENPSVLNKIENTCAAFIPIKKTDEWWLFTQDERRQIIAENSKHIAIGIKYLSTISRQLFHSRDIGEEFDFLTWFEFSPDNINLFNELLEALRSTEEWKYVSREVDIRMNITEF